MDFNLVVSKCRRDISFIIYKTLLSVSPSSRLYLINSPVVRAENLRFKEEGVRDVLKDVLLPWYNAYRFFTQNVLRLQKVRPKGCVLAKWVRVGSQGHFLSAV